MKLRTNIALTVGCGLISAVGLLAQASPPAPQQKPPAQQPAQKPSESNPFPEDTTSVPVVPTTAQPPAAPPAAESPAESGGAETTGLLKNDNDPVHSPDDAVDSGSAGADGFSSSLAGSGDVNIPDEDRPDKHRRGQQQPAVHQVTAKEDESVGEFELDRKNYKAALSRFRSALVTDSENPDVYWGIAEAQRGLGNYADAKANYQKVVDYDDPESKHSKEAKKLLKSAQLANAPAVSANQAPK
ncbi:tetratricopeptide repeat protein [Occallatibacter savannae]|uniref:tetratricopeptide repeat protein n=1 Tax=Occallatibacter savannae TaxID=1002691 RepID=UPI000D68B3A8|nr:tetratricopeptide repeat protein [Occallatibacter savannae]